MDNAKIKTANREIGAPGKRSLQEKDGRIGSILANTGWHSRGYLPHFDSAEFAHHVIFHLADSLPENVLKGLNIELNAAPAEKRDAERRKRIEAWMDGGHASCVLREPEIAAIVQAALLHFDSQRYRLLAWVVMPNHVHVLLQPINGWTVAETVASWKKHTARQICDYSRGRNRAVQTPVWHREYWDRYIRNESHLRQVIAYIHSNPVKARLVASADHWRWSSAFRGNADLAIERV